MKALRVLALSALGGLAACSLAPEYRVPDAPVPVQYADQVAWGGAAPADRIPRGAWWSIYQDTRLSQLEQQLLDNNPDLAAALAHYQQAQAYDAATRSGLFPTVSGEAQAARDRQSDTRPLRGTNQPDEYGSYTLGLEAVYELDLWGRVRNEVAAARAGEQAAAADLASAQLSLEARLADDYVALVGEDRQIQLLLDTVNNYEKALTLTQTLHGGGVVSGLDVSRAQTQLDGARAEVAESRAQRALLEHAIAALVGAPAPAFSLPPEPHVVSLPEIPAGLPSTLLERRPDIAAAERRMAAANAQIGVATAAYFPDLTLSGSAGFESSAIGKLLTAPSRVWSAGPQLAQTLFDAGLRSAQVDAARAGYEQSVAEYRQAVLSGLQQVEDELAAQRILKEQAGVQQQAVELAQQAEQLTLNEYKAGTVDFTSVVQAQATALNSAQSALTVRQSRLAASVDLVQALGGGWNATQLASER